MYGGVFGIIQDIKIKKIVIGKQFEESDNYKKLVKIAKEKKIIINIVNAGEKLEIEKELYFDVLWPEKEKNVAENSINNNSLVLKLNYKQFNILFTGDIEKIAEEEIVKKYKSKELKADILKIAHHGSKTSSIEKFIDLVSPQIALIGVGENNKFNHPNEEVIDRLEKKNIKIYRTDKNGEISLKINKCIKITKMVNNISKEKK
jgi:competence protein ComEC